MPSFWPNKISCSHGVLALKKIFRTVSIMMEHPSNTFSH